MKFLPHFTFATALLLSPLPRVHAQTAGGPSQTEVDAAKWVSAPGAIEFLKTFDFGKDDVTYVKFRQGVRLLDAAGRKQLEGEIINAGSTLSPGGRWIATRTLAWMGSEACVPLLTQWAKDGGGFDAVYALAGLNVPAADKALVEIFPAASDRLKASVINALADDHDPALVNQVATLLNSKEAGPASYTYLSAIASEEAIQVLNTAKPEGSLKQNREWALIDAAYQTVKDKHSAQGAVVFQNLLKTSNSETVRIAAAQGLLASDGSKAIGETLIGLLKSKDEKLRIQLAGAVLAYDRLAPQPEVITSLAASFKDLPEDVQLVLLSVVQRQGRKEFLPIVQEGMKSASLPVQIAAIKNLGLIGDASALDLLAPLLADPARRDDTVAAIARLKGTEVSKKILQKASGDPSLTAVWISIISLRANHDAMAFVVESAQSKTEEIRVSAFNALGNVAQPEDLGLVVGLRSSASGQPEMKAWHEAIVVLSKARSGDPAAIALLKPVVEKGDKEDLPYAASALAYLQLPAASELVKNMLSSPDLEVRKSLIRSLSGVRNTESASLLEIAATNGQDPAEKVLAVRGLLDTVKPLKLPMKEQLELFQKIWDLAPRAEEKEAVLAALKNLKNKDADQLAAKLGGPAA